MSLQFLGALVAGTALAAVGGVAPPAGAAEPPKARVVTICSDPWMPFAGDGRPGSDEGYVIELTREALARSGYQVRYVVVPWSRCIADVRSGRWDAIACVDAREVEDAIYPAEPVGETRPSLFTRTDSTWRFAGLPSLAGIRLGAIRNYAYSDDIDEWIRTNADDPKRVFLAGGTEPLNRLLEMLDAGRVDAIVENPHVAAWAARRLGKPAKGLRDAGSVRPLLHFYVAFSPKASDGPALAQAFDRGLRALRAEGKLDALLARYQVPAWSLPAGMAK
jgi:polar amino acid transport system substrate-binding protein